MAWSPDPDELAGVADLFGGLTLPELRRALAELAFKRGEDAAPADYDADVRAAVESYALLAVPHDGERVLVPGPTAFPALPDGAVDLPHILDAPERRVPDDARAERLRERLHADADAALADGDDDRLATLVDVTYDAEVWAGVDLTDVRERLTAGE
ncbi:MAG: hypothetical protein ABEJ42_07045 [Halobacteriaceae archaeon]